MNPKHPISALAVLAFSVSVQAQDPAQVERPEAKVVDLRIYVALEPISKVEQRVEELAITDISDTEIKMTEKNSSVVMVHDRNWSLKHGWPTSSGTHPR